MRDGSRATGHLCGPVPAAHLCGPVPAALTARLHPPRRAIPRRATRQEAGPRRHALTATPLSAGSQGGPSMPRLQGCRRAFTSSHRRAQRRSPPRNERSAAVGAARPHARDGSLNPVRTAVVQNSRLQIAIVKTAHRRPSCGAHTKAYRHAKAETPPPNTTLTQCREPPPPPAVSGAIAASLAQRLHSQLGTWR